MERKVKYSYEFKLRCVEEVIKNHRSSRSVAEANNFNESILRQWLNFYQEYGNQGLLPRKQRNYDSSFKIKVLETIEKEFLSLRSACVKFNITTPSTIIQWQKRYEKEGFLGLETKTKVRPKPMNFKRKKKKSDKPLSREEELLLEIESLKCENELLKKFNALIQSKESQGQKKPKP
ncbi:MAG: transposase [Ginsengibacter sp.]